jgi:hypothetical protein
MSTILSQLLSAVLSGFRDRASLQLELVALRHQLAVLERKRTTRLRIPEHLATYSSDIRPPIPGDPATFDTLV